MSTPPPFAWFDADDVERRLDYPLLFAAIGNAFAEATLTAPRISLPYAGKAEGSRGTLLLMTALQPERLAGVKIITYNAHRKSGTIKYIYVAFDPASGAIRAVIDGEALSTRRTAAVSVVAAKHLAAARPACIAVLGTGPVARELVKAYHAAYADAAIVLWGRRPEAARKIVMDLADRISVSSSPNLDELLRRADIVTSATASLEPFIKGDLLRHGAHVDLIGGFTPAMREADDHVFLKAAYVAVDNLSALQEAGDLCQPISAGVLLKQDIVTLEHVLAVAAPRRRDERRLTVFKSVGNSVFDLAAAQLCVGPLAEPTR